MHISVLRMAQIMVGPLAMLGPPAIDLDLHRPRLHLSAHPISGSSTANGLSSRPTKTGIVSGVVAPDRRVRHKHMARCIWVELCAGAGGLVSWYSFYEFI